MTLSFFEALTGLSQKNIEDYLMIKGCDPDDFEVMPFAARPRLIHKHTQKVIFLKTIREWLQN